MIDPLRVWVSEWIVCGFFAYLAVLASTFRISRSRRRRVLTVSTVVVGLTLMLSQLRLSPVLQVAREWLPVLYLMQGYWLCGLFFQRPMVAMEQRLMSIDRRVFRMTGADVLLARGPRPILEYFEFAYLMAYPFVPVAFGLLCWLGFRGAADEFWVMLLLAGYGAYGVLPWVQTRPPRSLERRSPLDKRGLFFRRVNVAVLNQASVQVNTFPSGHASTAIAGALAITTFEPTVGVVLVILAVSIAVATVLGRYHYMMDSVLGVLLGIGAWWVWARLI